MLNHIQRSRQITSFCYFLIKHRKPLCCSRFLLPLASNTLVQVKLFNTLQPNKTNCSVLSLSRQISKHRKNRESKYDEDDDSDESDDEENDDFEPVKGAEIKTYHVKSLRADSFLKLIFGYKRKRIEEDFYKKNIRINEEILKKKSTQVKEGDFLDLFLKFAPDNPKFVYVNRVEIIKLMDDPDSDNVLAKVQKSKSLLIENYPDGTWRIEDP